MAAAGDTAPLERILRGMNDVWVPSAEESGREMFNLAMQPRLLRVLACILGPELSFHRGLCRPKLPDLPHSAFPLHQDSQCGINHYTVALNVYKLISSPARL